MGGLPTAMLPRTLVFVTFGKSTIPLVLPYAVFSSTRLLSPLAMIPMPKSSLGFAKPLPVVSFHRSELLLPWIHMPPHAAAVVPFLAETFAPRVIREEVGFTRMPDMQFVMVVTPSTLPSSVPVKKIPSARNRCTMPGPRTSTSLWPFVLIPISPAVDAPLHPVVASACPVIVKPLSRSSIWELPN